MQFANRLSVRALILGSFAAVIAIVGICFAEVWSEMRKVAGQYEDVREETLRVSVGLRGLEAATSLLVEINWSHALAVRASRDRDVSDGHANPADFIERAIENEADELSEVRERIGQAWQAFFGTSDKDGAGGDLEFRSRLQERIERLQQNSIEIERLAPTLADEDLFGRLSDLAESGERLRELIDGAVADEDAELIDKDATVAEALEDTILSVVVGGALVLAVGLFAAVFLARRVARPLQELRDAAKSVGQGEFDVAVPTAAGGEVGELARSFGDMASRLKNTLEKMSRQDKLAVLGQLAGTVSHDLRNPLATIGASVHSLREASALKGFGIERTLDRMERSLGRCTAIVSDLLDFTRVRELNRETTAIDAWLGDVLDEHGLADSVVVVRELAAGAEVMLDREHFRRVMINLLDNAAQAMTGQGWTAPEGLRPTITVRTEVAGPHVRLSVADNGPGIKPENRARIFEPLFTTKSLGVGLGLPLVQQVTEQHGGTIDFTSAVDVGTTFTLVLPRATSQSRHAAPAGPVSTAA